MALTKFLCALLLPGFFRSAADAFQVASAPSTVDNARKSDRNHRYHHDFWRRERTHDEVKAHVASHLARIDEQQGTKVGAATIEVLSAEPPLVLVHDFLSATMCRDIIDSAKQTGNMQGSTIGNEKEANENKNSRSSSTVWLEEADCQHPLRLIAEKVASISGLPPSYMENLQVVRYEPGQEFKLHTDHMDYFNDLECRGRLATCLIYLSEPNLGGETYFPGMDGDDIVVSPTQGSAIFFWNTQEKPGSLDYEPNMFLHADPRMVHAGLPVIDGEKWICNRWIHPIDFGKGVRGL